MLSRERVLDMERAGAGAESPLPLPPAREALDTWVAALLSETGAAAASLGGGLSCRSC
jgi:hypothetical protein